MKNKLILILAVILCFIPTAVAYASYIRVQKAPVDEDTAVKITIDDVKGKKYVFEKKAEGDEADTLIKYFLSVKKNASKIVALPDSLLGEKFFKVSIYNNVRSEDFEYYFSQDTSTNYFRDSIGTPYKIAESDAEQFITSRYAESLYDNSTVPKMTSGNTEIMPSKAVWQYKNYTGAYVDADISGIISDEEKVYELEGGVNFSFDIEPDYCSVQIRDENDNLIYDDMYSALGGFDVSSTQTLVISVVAKWYEDPARSFCGELDYSFESVVTAPAEFYVADTTVEAGKFTALTALNVTKPELIEFTSTIETDPKPVFYKADGYSVAFLPIDMTTPSGLYTLTFKYGGVSQDTILTVKNGGEKVSYYTVPENVVSTYNTEAARSQFETAVSEIMSTGSSTKYYDGFFLQGVGGAYQLLRGFGRSIYLNGATTVSYRNNGVDYSSAAGIDVNAWNAGEVVYAGSLDYPGNIVVIEHGYGLKTWYYNLGSVSVSVGDIVEKGTAIGTTGQSGFTGQTGAHIAMSVGTSFVSPYDTWEDSETGGKIVIAKIDE